MDHKTVTTPSSIVKQLPGNQDSAGKTGDNNLANIKTLSRHIIVPTVPSYETNVAVVFFSFAVFSFKIKVSSISFYQCAYFLSNRQIKLLKKIVWYSCQDNTGRSFSPCTSVLSCPLPWDFLYAVGKRDGPVFCCGWIFPGQLYRCRLPLVPL